MALPALDPDYDYAGSAHVRRGHPDELRPALGDLAARPDRRAELVRDATSPRRSQAHPADKLIVGDRQLRVRLGRGARGRRLAAESVTVQQALATAQSFGGSL